MSCTVANSKNQVLFIKEEAVAGVGEVLTAAETVNVVSAEFRQELLETPDEQKRPTAGKVSRDQYHYDVGTFTIKCYIKSSGSLGVVPVEGEILKGVFGKDPTIVPATSVTYTLAALEDCIKTFTILEKKGYNVKRYTGCIFDKMDVVVKADNSADALVQMTVTGFYIKEDFAGTDALAVAIAGATPTITVDNADKYINTPKLIINDDDNGGVGWLIQSIDYATNIITLSTSISTASSIGAVVKGWTPTPAESGYKMHGRFGLLNTSIDGGSTVANRPYTQESNLSINNNIDVDNATKNNSVYPSVGAITRGDRAVPADFMSLFTKPMSGYDLHAFQNTDVEFVVPFGDTTVDTTKSGKFNMDKWRINPAVFAGDAKMTAKVDGEALESTNYDDSITLSLP